jgi:cytochrome P450
MSVSPAVDPRPSVPERPCPKARGYPVLGVMPQVVKDPLNTLTRIALEHPGEIVNVPFGPVRVYLVTHPPHVEHVLHTKWRNYGKTSPMWKPTRRVLGNGLVTGEGKVWVTSRRTLQPLFNHQALAALADRMVATIGRSLDQLVQRGKSGKPIEMIEEMSIITQNVILESVFDVDIDRDEAERLGAALAKVFRELNLRMFLAFLPEKFPLPGEERFRQGMAELDAGIAELTRRWETSPHKRLSMLSLMTEATDPETGEKLSPKQVRDELLTMWVAGNETTAIAMTWIWYLLDHHPEIDARVRAEVQEVLGQRTPTFADLERLTFCKRVFHEAIRLYPPSWFLPRQAQEDDVVGGFRIPKGATVVVSQYITHHTPSVWENPEAFDPDRFTPARSAGRHPYAFVPFGGGPRRCIGEHFGTMEAQLLMAMALQRFRPRMLDKTPVKPYSATTLRPRGKVMMRLQPL